MNAQPVHTIPNDEVREHLDKSGSPYTARELVNQLYERGMQDDIDKLVSPESTSSASQRKRAEYGR